MKKIKKQERNGHRLHVNADHQIHIHILTHAHPVIV